MTLFRHNDAHVPSRRSPRAAGKLLLRRLAISFCVAATIVGWFAVTGLALVLG